MTSQKIATSRSDATPARRINVKIGEEEYRQLIRLAGGPRFMGRWIERQVRTEVNRRRAPSVTEIEEQLRSASSAINNILRRIKTTGEE